MLFLSTKLLTRSLAINICPLLADLAPKETMKTPAPGNYDPRGTRYKSSPCWGMGSSKRAGMMNTATKFNPGPQEYEMRTTVGESAKYSVGKKLGSSLISTRFAPGPGAYSPTKPTEVSSSFSMGLKLDNQSSIGASLRKSAGKPGPGQHNADYTTAKKKMPAFSMTSRP